MCMDEQQFHLLAQWYNDVSVIRQNCVYYTVTCHSKMIIIGPFFKMGYRRQSRHCLLEHSEELYYSVAEQDLIVGAG